MIKEKLLDFWGEITERKETNDTESRLVPVVQLKRKSKKEKYYSQFKSFTDKIFEGLDLIQDFKNDDYIPFIASIKAEVSKDYADTFPYEDMTWQEMEEYEKALIDLNDEVWGHVDALKKEKARLDNLETGRLSLAALGADSVDNLDEIIRDLHEEKEEQRGKALEKVSLSLSASKGDKASMQGILNRAFGDPARKTEAKEETEEVSTMDGVDSSSGLRGNPKGE